MPNDNRISVARTLRVAYFVTLAPWGVALATTVSFQEGSGGYAGTADTFLQQAAPTSNNGALETVEWDSDDPAGTGQDNIALLRFDNIFGVGPGQIPAGSVISSATLFYTVSNTGNAGNVYESLVDWTEATAWDDFSGAGSPGVQANEYANLVASAAGGSATTFAVDVTASVARWSANVSTNKGWVILPTASDGVEFRSSEYAANVAIRPRLVVIFGAPPPLTLVRSPYLQQGTPSSVTLCWRTNIASDSRVRYGSAPTMLDQTVTDAAPVVDHFVTLSALSPGTRYYYDVGSTTQVLAGGDAGHYFNTSPTTGARSAFTVWVVGDSGNGSGQQVDVRDAMLAETGSTPPDLYIHVGDIAYNSGTETEFTNYFFGIYQGILAHTVCWPTLGNHEGTLSDSQTQSGPYYTAYVLPRMAEAGGLPSGTEAYYSFDYANVHFVCLDSHDTDRSLGSAMLTWLEDDLTATNQNWVIAFWHHPPYSKGSHDSDDPSDSDGRLVEMRENVLPILEAAGVDLVLSGHSHIYERSYLVDGAYDTPTTAAGHIVDGGDGRPAGDGAYLKALGTAGHEGAVYVVAGHGGASLGQVDVHPLMYFTELAHGSCIVNVDGNVLSLKNVRADGVVTDTFSLIKTPPGDLDTDGDVDVIDLNAFVAVLLGFDTDPAHIARSDINIDSVADGRDISGFAASMLANG
jgi:hypothetical protein